MLFLIVIKMEAHHRCLGCLPLTDWWGVRMWVVYSPCGLSWHLWPRAALQATTGRSIKCVYVWWGVLSSNRWLRVAFWEARDLEQQSDDLSIACCLLIRNSRETFFTVNAWQQSLCLMPVVDRVAGHTNIFPPAFPAGVVITAANQSTMAVSCSVFSHYFYD